MGIGNSPKNEGVFVEIVQRWIAPNVGELKCNVDAAIVNDKNCFSAEM